MNDRAEAILLLLAHVNEAAAPSEATYREVLRDLGARPGDLCELTRRICRDAAAEVTPGNARSLVVALLVTLAHAYVDAEAQGAGPHAVNAGGGDA